MFLGKSQGNVLVEKPASLCLDPKKTLNRHDAKAAKNTVFRSLQQQVRKPPEGAFRDFVGFPLSELFFWRSWRLGGLRISDWGIQRAAGEKKSWCDTIVPGISAGTTKSQ